MANSKDDLPGQAPGEAGKLNDKQEAFCREYLKDFNATRAYMRAYPGIKVSSADSCGPALLGNPRVASRLAELKAQVRKKDTVTRQRIVDELAAIAFGNLDDFIEIRDSGAVSLKKAPRKKMKAMTGFSYSSSSGAAGDSSSFSFRLEKAAALEKLIKHAGVFDEHDDLDTGDGDANDGGILGALRNLAGKRKGS